MKTTKTKINKIVEDYIKNNPKEYKSFLKGMRAKEEMMKNNPEMRSEIKRPLYEMPEVLYYMLHNTLEEDEWSWFRSLDGYQGKWEGTKWFVEQHPQFALIKEF